MLRTFNYTGRHKILQKEASFEILEHADDAPSFNARFEIDHRDMPDEAKVYVETWYKETRQRFDYGTLGNIIPPTDRKLNQIDLSGSTNFRVLIIDESNEHALILASGEGFRYDSGDDEGRSSLLAVKALPLDGLSWKLDFEDPDKPELIINSHIPNALEKMRSDAVFQALILPSAMSQILSRYLFSESSDMESEEFTKWLEFTQNFVDSSPVDMDIEEKEKWLDEVIEQFARRFEFSARLIDRYKEED